MISAAATGRLDYRDADSDDIVWLLRERTMLNYVERETLVDLTKQRQLQQVATACPAGDMEGKIWSEHYDSGHKQLELLAKLMFPWLSFDKKDQYRSEIAALREEYTRKFGDPSSPEAKERDKRDKAALKRQQLAAKQKAQEDANRERELSERIKKIRDKRSRRR